MLAKYTCTGLVLFAIGVQACGAPDVEGLNAGRRGPGDKARSGDGSGDNGDGQTPTGDDSSPKALPPEGTSDCKGATPLVAFVGGASIAIRWSTIGSSGTAPKEYAIYRNGTKIGTATPGFNPEFPEKDGKGFVDKDIAAGASYEYRVEAIDSKNVATDVGAPLCVVAPKELAPPPKVQLDYSQSSDLSAVMLSAKTFVEIWYPKVAVVLALPSYSPMSSFRIRLDPTYDGVAYADSGVPEVVIRSAFLRDHPQDFGMFIHEVTHLLNSSKGTPGWIGEGIADWTREYMVHDRDPVPIGPNHHYTQGYSQACFFLNWIQDTYQKPMLRTLNIAGNQNAYSRTIFAQETGKTMEALWEELTGRKERSPGPIRFTNIANKCIDGTSYRARVATCNGGDAQGWKWGMRSAGDGTIWLEGPTGCLDVQQSGTANGAPVGSHPCNDTGAQTWKLQANGALLNPQSGRCLDNPNGTTVDGTDLQLWDCNGAPAQTFTLPP